MQSPNLRQNVRDKFLLHENYLTDYIQTTARRYLNTLSRKIVMKTTSAVIPHPF